MLRWIVQHSLRFRWIVLAMACLVTGYGIYVSLNSKLDVFPEFVQPQVVVQTEAPGLSSEQVEALVTRPVEGALAGAGGLDSIRSESIEGLSVVTAVFAEGSDIYRARQMLGERLASISGELPAGVKSPKMTPLMSSTMDVLKFGLMSDKLTPMQLRSFADWTIRPRLLAIPGVAKVSTFGGEVRQLQIQVRPESLIAFDVSLPELVSAARNVTGVRGAGFIETSQQRLTIQTEGQVTTVSALQQAVVAVHGDKTVRLKDLATVTEAAEPKFGAALIMGRPGVLVTANGQLGANTMELTKALEAALEEMKPAFAAEGIEYVPRLHRPANFIESSLANVQSSLLLGGILVGVILFLFLLDWRTAFISFTAIPVSLLTAMIILNWQGVTINTMTLGGFAVAIGVVVDDAIIDVENILRRLRNNAAAAKPSSFFEVVLEASLEVRSAVVYASFVVALVFLPVLMMSGLQGRFFAPLGTAFILAIAASLAVALTLTPALCMVLLGRVKPHSEPRYIGWLKRRHHQALLIVSRWPRSVIALIGIVVCGAVATLPFFGGEFLPEFREGHFVVQVSMVPGTSVSEMMRLGERISSELLKNPKIQTVEEQIGRAEMGEDTWGPFRSEFHVELKPSLSGEDQESAQDEIRSVLKSFSGIQSEVLTFLGDRIGETIAGETAPVVINVFADDLDIADQKAQEVAHVLSKVPDATDVLVKASAGAPRISVALRQDRVAELGFQPVQVLEAVENAYQGAVVAQVYEGNRVSDVTVILEPGARQNPQAIGSLMLQSVTGLRLPLKELADIRLTTGRYSIFHEGVRRRQTVTCSTAGRDVTSFVKDAKAQIAKKVVLPAGAYLTFSGAAEQQARAQHQLLLHSGIAGAAIVLLLAIVFGNWRNLLLVLANIPFALVGGVLAAFLTGYLGSEGRGNLSLGSLVGFVTLFGITARNSIMMISHFDHLVRDEGMTWGLEAALRGAEERLVPILMTALVTGIGLLPLAIGTGEAGREIEGPMAIVILGGLLTSTALNLLVLPTLALRFGRFGVSGTREV